jgi:hypothetical protein
VAEAVLASFLKFLVGFCVVTGMYPVILHIPNLPEAMRWEFGVFREVGAYASVMNIGVASALAIAYHLRSRTYFWFAVLLSSFVFITILKKTMVSNLIVWSLFFIFNTKKMFRKEFITAAVVLVPMLLFVFRGAISSNLAENADYLEISGPEEHVRIGMYITSVRLASDFFPLGSGFGSFGSLGSIFNWYSPIYYDYSIDKIGSNAEEFVLRGEHTLLDTFWPHVIGELGFLGAVFYLGMALFPSARVLGFLRRGDRRCFAHQLGIFLVSVNLAIIWEGLSLYNPETPVFMFFTGLLTGLVFRLVHDRQRGHPPAVTSA